MTLRNFGLLLLLVVATAWPSAYAESKSCGIEAAYGAVNALGIKARIHVEELLTKEFISERGGSTAQDVCAAVSALGAEALFVEGMGWASLVGCKYPMILNVSSDGQLIATNHWLLFLGFDGSLARVVNGEGKVENWRMERLLVRWRGKGIIVSPQGESVNQKYRLNRSEICGCLTSITGGIVLCSLMISLFYSKVRRQFLGLLVVLSIVVYELASTCFFSHAPPPLPGSTTTRYVFATLYGSHTSEISLVDFIGLLKSPENAVLIDCRYDSDYRAAPIQGTINIPVDAGTSKVSETLSGKSFDQKIVLFCMSEGCGFAKVMSTRLTGLGFSNLYIFPGGYREWQNYVSKR